MLKCQVCTKCTQFPNALQLTIADAEMKEGCGGCSAQCNACAAQKELLKRHQNGGQGSPRRDPSDTA